MTRMESDSELLKTLGEGGVRPSPSSGSSVHDPGTARAQPDMVALPSVATPLLAGRRRLSIVFLWRFDAPSNYGAHEGNHKSGPTNSVADDIEPTQCDQDGANEPQIPSDLVFVHKS